VASVDQLFWIDETGCNRHTLLRRHGRDEERIKKVKKGGKKNGEKKERKTFF
jgi:hypothetical protein